MKVLVITLFLLLMALDFTFFCRCRTHNPNCPEHPGWTRRLLALFGVCLALGLIVHVPSWLELLLTVAAVLAWRRCCNGKCRGCEEPLPLEDPR